MTSSFGYAPLVVSRGDSSLLTGNWLLLTSLQRTDSRSISLEKRLTGFGTESKARMVANIVRPMPRSLMRLSCLKTQTPVSRIFIEARKRIGHLIT